MIRILALACVLVAGCSDKKRVRQNRDAAPVVVVDVGPGGTRSTAPPTDEKEPNQTTAEATALALGGAARGSLDGSADVDVYKLAVTGTGALEVAVSGVDGVDLALEIADASGTVVAKSDRGPAATGEGVPNLGVIAGDYFVTVKEFVKPAKPPKKKKKGAPDAAPAGRTGPSPAYEVTARLTKPADATEREPDDDPGAANDIFPGDTVTGYVGWTGDVDVWKLSLEALTTKNAFDVEVTGVDGVALTVEIGDAAGAPLQTRKGAKGLTVALRSVVPRLAEGSPPFHFLKIAGDRSNPEASYTLTVRGRLLEPDEELEPNDKRDSAQPLTGDRGTIRAAYAAGDVDCFAVEPGTTGRQLELTVVAPDGVDTVIEVATPAGVLAKTDLAEAGADEKVDVAIPAATRGTACVSFKPVKADPGTPRDYTIDYRIDDADALPPEE